MGRSSKILLDFEKNNDPSASSIQSKLIVCQKNDPIQSQPAKPSTISSSAPKSQVLGKVKDFLGLMAESNKKLQIDAMNNPKEYDIEAITGDESEYIELDLMLGVADLHTPEAVAAAESAISSYHPVIQLDESSDNDSELESEDSSDDDDDDSLASKKSKRIKDKDDDECSSLGEVLRNCTSKKRSKIVEIS